MRRVLITGASGFLGRPCLAELTGAGDEVHAGARAPMLTRGCHWHRADLLDPAAVDALVSAVRPTHLLHLAWVTAPGAYWTSPDNLPWVEASLRLLRRFAEQGGERVVTAGSCAEYDWNAGGTCHEETTPLRPATLYGVCKDALRRTAEAFARQAGLSAAWARLFYLYGRDEHPDRLVASVARALLGGVAADCSSGAQRRDFLHADDAAAALVALLHSDVRGAVNVGSGEAVAVRDVASGVGAAVGRPDLVRLGARPDPVGEPPVIVADVGRLRREVGWRPRFTLEQGLADAVAWWRNRRCA